MRNFFATLAIVFITTFAAFAQTNTGRLNGTVSGPDGVLPGANITVTDDKTGREFSAVSSGQGGFVIPQLDSGTYTVKVSANGFKTAVRTNVIVNIGQEYTLEVALELGAVSESVTVTAGEDLVNSTSAELSRNISERQIKELPLNGRNPLALIQLQAGTSSNPNQGTAINGFRTSSSNIVQDGINVQDNFIRSNATDFSPGRASVGNVEQFTITTQAGADRGFGGPQIELVTPRGQNKFRGEAFAFNRNSKFGANSFFNNAAGRFTATSPLVVAGLRKVGELVAPRAFLNRNQFGGSVSGPIVKNKLFFFGYYEGLRLRTEGGRVTTTLTSSARTGLFTYIDNAGVTRQVNLFNLGAPVPGTNPPTGINSVISSRFLSKLPAGNTIEAGDGLNTTGYRFNVKSLTDRDQATTRIDYDINGRNSINGVYDYSKEDNLRSDIDTTFNITPTVTQPAINKRMALAWTTSIGSNFTSQTRGGFFFSTPTFTRLEANPSEFYAVPLITNPEVTFQNQGRAVRTYNFQNTSDYIWGNHSFRFGGQFQKVRINSFNDAGIVSTYTIGTGTATPVLTSLFTNATAFPGGISTAQRNTANALYALLGGIVTAGTKSFNATSQDSGFVSGATQRRIFTNNVIAGFFQDQWRVVPNFTLTLGLRYDLYGALRSENGLALEPVIANGRNPVEAILDPAGRYQFVGGNAGKKNQFWKTDKNDFSPVINFAYSANGGENSIGKFFLGKEGATVLRGGFRFSYVNDEAVRAPDNALLGNQGLAVASSALSGGAAALNDRVGTSLSPIPTPVFNNNRSFLDNNTAAFTNFGTVFAVDPNLQTPRVMEYNIGIQRELGNNLALEVRYVGSRSKNLWRTVDYNQVDIRSNGFAADFNRARSNFLLCAATTGCATGGGFNAAIPGSQVLTVFPNLASGGLLTNGTITGQLQAGTPADLAIVYIQNALAGTVRFVPNLSTGVANVLENGAFTRYNSLQVELRRRFAQGLDLQANYTFSKTLTNGQGTAQTRVEAFLDNQNRALDVSRADFDQTHVFNLNALYELPFGKGKRFLNQGGIVNQIFGGWQATTIVRLGSGSPITITDARGTLNRAGRSGRQTALTSLSKSELKKLFGTFKTANGVFFINPTAIGRNADGSLQPGQTGRGANGFGTTPFTGQVFFNNAPGQTSGLERAFLNGPTFFNWDASLIKDIRFTETVKLQIRAEAFNLTNRANLLPAQFLDINGTNFGRITATPNGGGSARVVQFGARFLF